MTKTVNKPRSRWMIACLGCLGLTVLSVCCLAGAVFVLPAALTRLGIISPEAEDLYALAPDPYSSEQIRETFSERNIPGVRVYVIPMSGQPTQGAFIILDSSAGYVDNNPLEDNDDAFLDILVDITHRNQQENLRIAHVTVDYRDENGETALAFTVPLESVESYANGSISRSEFFEQVQFDLYGTLQYLGIDGLLEE